MEKKIEIIRTITKDDVSIVLKLVEGWNDYKSQEVGRKLLKHIISTNGEIIRYKDLAKKVDFECEAHFIDRYFEALSFSCIESGIPIPSAIVVNDELMPGDGFCKAYFPGIKDKMKRMEKSILEMKKVQEYKHWDLVLELFTGNND